MEKVFNKKIKKNIDKKSVISFDVFDTLIKRNCLSPKDIFEIVQKKFVLKYNETLTNFAKLRIEAEIKARNLLKKEEITLDEIYDEMEIESTKKSILKQMEIDTEIEFCQKNNIVYPIYQYCKQKNKKVICISDMYLPKEVISKILKNNEYDIDELFISSEYRSTKLTGNLFKRVLGKLNISKKNILHIGDSYKADLLGPIKVGIKAYHIRKRCNNGRYKIYSKKKMSTVSLSENIALSVINNNVVLCNTNYEKIGYEIIGPLCCGFASWINKIAQENKLDKLLFCARDMYMIQKIYNKLFSQEISNDYFYISRKSTYLPYLYINQEFQCFQQLIPIGKRKILIEELLEMFNIKVNCDEEIFKKYNVERKKQYDLDVLKNSDVLRDFYENYVLNIIREKGKEQYNNLLNYMNSLGVKKRTAIVDLGWRGTTQKILIDITKNNIYGIYYGLQKKYDEYLKENYWTYLFDGMDDLYARETYSFMALIELMLSALHGSTISYSSDEKNPYQLKDSANKENAVIETIQKYAYKFCEDVFRYINYIDLGETRIFAKELIKIGISPKLEEAVNFGDIMTENIKVRSLASPRKLSYYLKRPKCLKTDLLNSEWKIGFMKRLFKLNFSYYKIYGFFRKKIMKE